MSTRASMSMTDLLAALRARTRGQRIERVCKLLGYRCRFIEMRAESPCEACGVCGKTRTPFAMVVTAVHHVCTDCAASADDLKVTTFEMLRDAAIGDHRRKLH